MISLIKMPPFIREARKGKIYIFYSPEMVASKKKYKKKEK